MLSEKDFRSLYCRLEANCRIFDSIKYKAELKGLSVDDYLWGCDGRRCVLLPSGCLSGVSDMDMDYRYYFVYGGDEKIIVEEGDVVMSEYEGLLKLLEYDKVDSERFYKWGFHFSLEGNGRLVIRSYNGTISIVPRASNSIVVECR